MPQGVRFSHNPVQSVSRLLTEKEERSFRSFEEHVQESSACDQRLEIRAFADCCAYCRSYIIYLTSSLERREGQHTDRESCDRPFTLVEIPPWYPATRRILESITESARLRLRADSKRAHETVSNRSRNRPGYHVEDIPRVNSKGFSNPSTRQCSNKGIALDVTDESNTEFSFRRLVISQEQVRSESSYKTLHISHRWRESATRYRSRLNSYP